MAEEGTSPLPCGEGPAHVAAARRMAALACAAAAACAATMACRRATDAAACHGRRLKPVGFRRWRLAGMAAGGAMMVVARVPLTSFYRGLETFNGLATPFGGLIASSCGWVVWQPSTGVC